MNSRFMSVNNKDAQNNVAVNSSDFSDAKPQISKEKLISYEEKSVGSTTFFQCEACPYMAFAEDDIKFHLFTVHPELAKSSGLADNVQISCPGCTCIFDTEETLRTHLRTHHKMGVKDVKKMVKSLVQIALKNAKLKKEDTTDEPLPPPIINSEKLDVKMPQLIEIVPNVSSSDTLPQGVAYISVDELQKMSTPNFNKVDPKEIIHEASINIVYANDISTQYVNVADTATPTSSCNVIKLSNATPDLISSIQPRVGTDSKILLQSVIENVEPKVDSTPKLGRPPGSRKTKTDGEKIEKHQDLGTSCMVNNCCIRLKDPEKLAYHRKCHLDDNLQCPECAKVYTSANPLHTHLWKSHGVDLELPTCEICGFKTSKKHRLYNIHMKCHKNIRLFECPVCGKLFKNASQLSKHKLTHKTSNVARCSICQLEFSTQRKLTVHVKAVHEKVKPFKCGQCDYKAARKEEIKLHMRSHTGDKPYSCNQCSYRSADHNAMRRHRKRHSNESLYKCKFCSYSTIQSTVFASHMISKHPNVKSNDIFRCPYCAFKSVNKDKYVIHLTTHTDKEGIQILIEMTQNKNSKPSWTIPSEVTDKPPEQDEKVSSEQNNEGSPKSLNTIPIEVYDCDSLSESLPQNYSKSYCTASDNDVQQTDFNSSLHVTDLSKDDNNSDLISESSNDTLIERHRFTPQHTLTNITYDNSQSNLHGFLNTSVPMQQNLLQNDTGNAIVSNHSLNIMSNFPIRLPSPQISMQNNVIYKQIDKISVPMKVIGIKPNGRICVGHDSAASSSSSPINMSNEPDTPPRKKPKISVKSNLILKGPDAVNMFHSQQKLAFKRLEDHERFGLESPVTFNNLITTQFMQLQQEPELSESPSDIMPYTQKSLLEDTATTPVSSGINNDAQMFSFNPQMNNSLTILPPPQKIQSNDPSYIKIEATIKQNTQSPSLERMCTANIPQTIGLQYKASPPLEDIHKNINEIKNEMKSDSYYSMPLNNADSNPSLIEQYLIDGGVAGEQYLGHMDLSSVVLPEINDDQQNDVIEIDDNSDDNKMLPRFDMNFPLESLYLMHNDFHFLDSEMSANNLPSDNANEINRMVNEVPLISSKDSVILGPPKSDFHNAVNCKKDPMINTTVRPCTNKINVKNIELMKN